MILYHGTTGKIDKPDISYSKDYLGFGRGFYLTTYKDQAENWAIRKATRRNGTAIVNVYELDECSPKFKVQSFEAADEKWLDYVCSCRRGENSYKEYDVVIGRVADDDVFKTVDMYFRGLWDKSKALEELRYYKDNDQICITNQKVLDEKLRFIDSYEVIIDGR